MRTPLGGARAEDPERRARGLEVARLAEPDRAARQRLDPGALRQAAGPRRPPAVEVEEVLERDPAGALRGERERVVEQLAQVVVVRARLPQRVGLAERPEPLDLQALAGVVLPDERAALKAHALAVAQQPPARPPLPVARDRLEERRQPRDDEVAAGGDRVEVARARRRARRAACRCSLRASRGRRGRSRGARRRSLGRSRPRRASARARRARCASSPRRALGTRTARRRRRAARDGLRRARRGQVAGRRARTSCRRGGASGAARPAAVAGSASASVHTTHTIGVRRTAADARLPMSPSLQLSLQERPSERDPLDPPRRAPPRLRRPVCGPARKLRRGRRRPPAQPPRARCSRPSPRRRSSKSARVNGELRARRPTVCSRSAGRSSFRAAGPFAARRRGRAAALRPRDRRRARTPGPARARHARPASRSSCASTAATTQIDSSTRCAARRAGASAGLASLGLDPARLDRRRRRSTGTATIGGVETTHVSGTIDVKRLLDDVAKLLGGSATAAARPDACARKIEDAVKSTKVDVWTGHDGQDPAPARRRRRLRLQDAARRRSAASTAARSPCACASTTSTPRRSSRRRRRTRARCRTCSATAASARCSPASARARSVRPAATAAPRS